jgi:hypothetical protein
MRIVSFILAVAAVSACSGTLPDESVIVGKHPANFTTCGVDVNGVWHWAVLDVHPVADTAVSYAANTEFQVDFEIVNVGEISCDNAASQWATLWTVVQPSSTYAISPATWDIEPGDSVRIHAHYRATGTGTGTAGITTDYNGYMASVAVHVP